MPEDFVDPWGPYVTGIWLWNLLQPVMLWGIMQCRNAAHLYFWGKINKLEIHLSILRCLMMRLQTSVVEITCDLNMHCRDELRGFKHVALDDLMWSLVCTNLVITGHLLMLLMTQKNHIILYEKSSQCYWNMFKFLIKTS